jgi:hypothetical protein
VRKGSKSRVTVGWIYQANTKSGMSSASETLEVLAVKAEDSGSHVMYAITCRIRESQNTFVACELS